MHGVPRKGFAFDGQQLAAHAFRVARIRWTWDLQRPRFRAAAISGPLPELGHHQSGARLPEVLPPNDARDVDLVVSYGKPYWPDARGSLRDNARLGPLPNDAGLWLTATSYLRSQAKYPAPEQLCPRLPEPGEEPNRITCGGRRDATDEQIRTALRRAGLLEWVEGLPAGLDTDVGEYGVRLSGGQRQRLSLARVLLADFPVLVLDEPTEHLDEQTADELTRDLLAATEGRTILLITHRSAGLDQVDEIVSIQAGRLAAVGRDPAF